jgi:adenylate cyclase class 2
MYEVELKVRADHDAMRERLVDIGATELGAVTQVDTYYDAPHREFAQTDEAVRLRAETRENGGEEATSHRLTYKGPLFESASKTREEIEVEVPESDSVDAILCNLGFEPAATVRKNRDRYEYEGYHVVLDDVANLGEFVEVEAEATEESVESVREGATEVLDALGLDPAEQIRTSYLVLLLEAD